MARPWMPIYVGDYVRDTTHLSTVQHGAYILLILHYWTRGELPDDDQQLANITRLSLDQWQSHRPILQKFFYDGWKHKRIETELRRSVEKADKARLAGEKGRLVAAMNRETARHTFQSLASKRHGER